METLNARGIYESEQLFDENFSEVKKIALEHLNPHDHDSLDRALADHENHKRNWLEHTRAKHCIFLSHYKYEAGTEAALMQKDLERLIRESTHFSTFCRAVFLDSEDLQDLAELQSHVQSSHNLVLLLTPGVLTRPWVLVEVVTAMRCGARVVPVEIQLKGRTFVYPDKAYFERLRKGETLQRDAMRLLRSQNISLQELTWCLQQVFSRIAVSFSPHRSDSIRQAELKDLLKHCKDSAQGDAIRSRRDSEQN